MALFSSLQNEPVSSEKVDSLQEELQAIREERDRLRDKVGLLDEDYQVLTVQNKMVSEQPLFVVLSKFRNLLDIVDVVVTVIKLFCV